MYVCMYVYLTALLQQGPFTCDLAHAYGWEIRLCVYVCMYVCMPLLGKLRACVRKKRTAGLADFLPASHTLFTYIHVYIHIHTYTRTE